MNKEAREKFLQGDFSITFKYLVNENSGTITYFLDHLEKITLPDFKKLLNTILQSNESNNVFDYISDFLTFCTEQDFFKAEKVTALKNALNGYILPKQKKEKATPADKLAKRFLTVFKKASYKLYGKKDGYIYLTDSFIGIKIPESKAGAYLPYIDGAKEFSHFEGFERLNRDNLISLKSSFIDTRNGKKISAEYYSGNGCDVLLNSAYTKIFKGLNINIYSASGSAASKTPVYIESADKDGNGDPFFTAIIAGMYINGTAEQKINEIKRLDVKGGKEEQATTKEGSEKTMKEKTIQNEKPEAVKTETAANLVKVTFKDGTVKVFSAEVAEALKNDPCVDYIGDKPEPVKESIPATAEPSDNSVKESKKPEKEPIELTPETVNESNYKEIAFQLFGGLGKKANPELILLAGISADVITCEQFKEYLFKGRFPKYHTFEAWKDAGYIVKKGEKALFKADIWKYTEKHGKMTAEEAASLNAVMVDESHGPYKEGDETTKSRFIKKLSFFFGPDQVEKIEKKDFTVPDGCKLETVGDREIITGDTLAHKDAIKAAGFFWDRKNKCWYRAA